MSGMWSFKGDPARSAGWTVIGENDEGEETALVSYDSLMGAASRLLTDGPITGEWIMDRPKAEELHDRILTMDQTYWPGFNPTVARVENGEVVERVYPPEDASGAVRDTEGQG